MRALVLRSSFNYIATQRWGLESDYTAPKRTYRVQVYLSFGVAPPTFPPIFERLDLDLVSIPSRHVESHGDRRLLRSHLRLISHATQFCAVSPAAADATQVLAHHP